MTLQDGHADQKCHFMRMETSTFFVSLGCRESIFLAVWVFIIVVDGSEYKFMTVCIDAELDISLTI